jgi:hypothetical protein
VLSGATIIAAAGSIDPPRCSGQHLLVAKGGLAHEEADKIATAGGTTLRLRTLQQATLTNAGGVAFIADVTDASNDDAGDVACAGSTGYNNAPARPIGRLEVDAP